MKKMLLPMKLNTEILPIVWIVAKRIAMIAASPFTSPKHLRSTKTVFFTAKFLEARQIEKWLPFQTMMTLSAKKSKQTNCILFLLNQSSIMIFFVSRPKTLPADPVSISIAYRSANRAKVDEDEISYGFKKAPVDMPRVKIVKNVPEEKLWEVDHRSIIELKKEKAKCSLTDDEDIDEMDPRDLVNPGYEDLGYAPVIKAKLVKPRKSHDFELEPLKRESDEDDRHEFEDDEVIFKRGKVVTAADGEEDIPNSPEAPCVGCDGIDYD